MHATPITHIDELTAHAVRSAIERLLHRFITCGYGCTGDDGEQWIDQPGANATVELTTHAQRHPNDQREQQYRCDPRDRSGRHDARPEEENGACQRQPPGRYHRPSLRLITPA